MKGTRINKRTLPSLYARARTEAYKPGTIKTAFRKAGIWPLDRTVIEDEAYEPSKNTSSKASMPIPSTLPDILVPVAVTESSTTLMALAQLPYMVIVTERRNVSAHLQAGNINNIPGNTASDNNKALLDHQESSAVKYDIVGLLPPSRRNATIETLKKENHQLRQLLEQAKAQIEADHALKILMEGENEKLREELHGKKKVERKRAPGEGQARLMTSSEQLDALALYDWKKSFAAVLGADTVKKIFKGIREAIKLDEDTRAETIRREKRAEAMVIKAALTRSKKATAALQRVQKADERREEKERNRLAREEEKLLEKARKLEARLKAVKKPTKSSPAYGKVPVCAGNKTKGKVSSSKPSANTQNTSPAPMDLDTAEVQVHSEATVDVTIEVEEPSECRIVHNFAWLFKF